MTDNRRDAPTRHEPPTDETYGPALDRRDALLAQLEIPAFLRRQKGEKRPPWTPPPAGRDVLKPRDPDATTAAFLEQERQRRRTRDRNRRRARELAKRPKPDLTGMRWDPWSNQHVPDPSAPADQRRKAMSMFSKPQSKKWNAQASAERAGIDRSKVVPAPGGGWYYPLPEEGAKPAKPTLARAINESTRKTIAKGEKKARKPRAGKKAAASSPRAEGKGDKVIGMLRARWTPMSDIVKETGWEKHTARAFISRLRSKDKLAVESEKRGEEQHYRIAA